jgi:plasmid stabilization system protein ParE
LRAGLRSLIAHPYVVFYRIDDALMVVTVLRILHGRMDLDSSEIDDTE